MSRPELAFRGELVSLSEEDRRRLFLRGRHTDPGVGDAVEKVLAQVRDDGDAAIRDLTERFDGVRLGAIEVDRAACERALEELDPALRDALRRAAEAIEKAHRAQLSPGSECEVTDGVRVGRRQVPLRRVGAYAPGGRAAYPSSVLMCAIPARVAGVDELIVCSPPGATGLPSPVVMAACAIAGVDRLFAVGGATAVAAMAYGTDTVPAVDKIVGPGGIWVDEAKLRVHRDVAIDCPAGPSEVLVVADEEADPELVAGELLAQAEHDPAAWVALVTPARDLIERVEAALARQLADLPTAETAREALAAGGALLQAGDLEEAFAFSEEFAAEHLLLAGPAAAALADRVRTAGCVFFGGGASVAFGDYASGANHVLPTGGRARAWSGLGVSDFQRAVSWQRIEPSGARALAPTVAAIANAEGLPGHAAAALLAAERVGQVDEPANTGAGAPPLPAAVPAGIRATRRYDPGRRECETELSDNTNLFGSAPSAIDALHGGSAASVRRYPTVYGDRLKEALADWLGVAPENVATGCGSDDLMDASFHAFAGGGGRIAFSDPTFSMVRAFGTMNDARTVPVPTDSRLRPDLEALATTEADLLYVCRPDNPSGHLIGRGELDRLLDGAAATLVLDEAYMPFADEPSIAPDAPASERLVVLGTFSKAWGLAGLRIGYAIGPGDRIDLIERARGPYKLNAAAEAAAAAALRSDRDWFAKTVAAARKARVRLFEALRERDLDVMPSQANFLFLRLPDPVETARFLRDRGVGVRPFAGLPGGGGIRVTVGPKEDMGRFLRGLDDWLAISGTGVLEEADA